jgi:hypothetical protein
MRTLPDWRGNAVTLAESHGGVLAFRDVQEGLIRGNAPVWPTPEITQKLHKSRHQTAYRHDDLDAVVTKLGYYCDLQSVHSEDAITWNVFGPISYADEAIRLEYCASLFQLIDPSLPPPTGSTISLWRRVPHPETDSVGGPEVDVLIQTPEVVVVGEAKWMSAVGSGQGVDKNKDQLALRKEYLEGLGRRIYATETIGVVLSIGIEPAPIGSEPDADGSNVLDRYVTWKDLCAIPRHPLSDELGRHHQWKMSNSRLT